MLAFGAVAARAQFVWTGAGNDGYVNNGLNWSGGVAPAGLSGTDDFSLTASGNHSLNFTSPFIVRHVNLTSGLYDLTGTGPVTLNGDVTTAPNGSGYLFFSAPLILSAGQHNFSLGTVEVAGIDVAIFGQISGTGGITKYGQGSLFFDHTDGNLFTGTVDLQEGRIVVHGDSSLGTGLLKMNGGTIAAADYYDDSHTSVLANDVLLSGQSYFGDYYGKGSLTFTGTTTANSGLVNSTAYVNVYGSGLLTFGNVTETSSETTFQFQGGGAVRIAGNATYSGGTQVVNNTQVIFAHTPTGTGYLAEPDDGFNISYIGTEQTTSVASFLGLFDTYNTYGILGFDTHTGSPAVVNENIDLTGFDSAVRLGTATAAIFNGTITPGTNAYLFGGRGVLTVNSNLTGANSVEVSDGLQLFLAGTNDYTGYTYARHGGAAILASSGAVTSGVLESDYGAYVGYTEATGLSVSSFFNLFNTGYTYGVVGFDSTNPASPRTINEAIDLSATDFSSDIYLGTSTAVILNGTITPIGTEYRFTGFRDGQLTINSALTGAGNAVRIGQDDELIYSLTPVGSNFRPSVTLNGNNTYGGGTTLQSGGLILGHASALGTGQLTVSAYGNSIPWLSTNTADLTIANPIDTGTTTNFEVGGTFDFTLSGNITSAYEYSTTLRKFGTGQVTFSGDNSGLYSRLEISSGTVAFTGDYSAGNGMLSLRNFDGADAQAIFTSAHPVVGGLSGDWATQVNLGSGTLTIRQVEDGQFDGVIVGTGGLVLSSNNILTLSGANTYTGGTTVENGTLEVTSDGQVNHPGADLVVGVNEGDEGELDVTKGGTVAANNVVLGENSYSWGGMTVDGAGSTLTAGSSLTIGANGEGDFTVSKGGHASAYGTFVGESGYGYLTVSDAGSLLSTTDEIIIGAFGSGHGYLSIEAGGVVSAGRGSIGYVATGTATIDGAGSAWNNTGYLYVGSGGGNGHLVVQNGGVVTSNSGEIGLDSAYGNLVLTGTGSRWDVATNINVGHNGGTGILELIGQSLLNVGSGSGTITLAVGSGSYGTLMIGESEYSPYAGTINAGTITSGGGGALVQFDTGATKSSPYYLTKDGTSGGANVQITGNVTVSNYGGYNVLSGTNTYTGGTVLYGGTLVAGSNGALGTGNISFSGGRLSIASGVVISNPVSFSGSATLGGNGTWGSPITVSGGVDLAPGNSVGLLTFASGTTWGVNGTYDVEIQTAGGARGVGYDSIDVTGGLTFNATLGSPFTIRLISLDGSGNPGNVGDFNSSTGYAWLIAHTDGITGFNASAIQIQTTNFTNSTGIGGFYVTAVGNDVYLNFSPVPEPSTYLLMLLGLGSGAVLWRKKPTRS